MYIVRTLVTVSAVFCLLPGCATTVVNEETRLTEDEIALNIESFDYIWTTMRDRNWDTDLGGLDWDAVRDEMRPQVADAGTMHEARSVMTGMLKQIEQTHLSIIPASVYAEIDVPAKAETVENLADVVTNVEVPRGVTGLTVRVVNERLLVTDVEPNSPAEEAGVMRGWEITAIDGDRIAPIIRDVTNSLGESTMRQIILSRTFSDRMDGPINAQIDVRFRDADMKRKTLSLGRALPEGEDIVFGNLPVGPVWLKHRAIGDDIGYIAFNVFMDPVNLMTNFAEAVESYRDRSGIVLDLRGNRGGIAAMAMGLAGWFVSEPDAYLGTMYMRSAELKMVVNPRLESYKGPVAILVDGCSASCAEIFAGGLRDLGRARIFGSPTAGAALPAAVERLPNGDGFMYPVANYISRNGDRFEGIGVLPDVDVGYSRDTLLAGRDGALEAASEWIRESVRPEAAGGGL